LFFPAVAVSVPLAVLSYRYVELPFLRRRYGSIMPASARGLRLSPRRAVRDQEQLLDEI
jgi:peptidoglycan/LPS O-acetylase OafA/YrhL